MKLLKLTLILALVATLGTACDSLQQRDRTFDDDPKLEFVPLSNTVDEGDGNQTVNIQLIGPQRDSDLPVSFSVADSSTAEEGVHYSLSSTSATIPANSSRTEIQIQVLDDDRENGDSNLLLYLNLQDSEGVAAAENLKTHTLTIRGLAEE